MQQFGLFHAGKDPIGFALWANVSDAVDKDLDKGRARLKPEEWRSGQHLWLMDLVAPSLANKPKAMQALMAELAQSAFGDRAFKFRHVNPKTGKPETATANVKRRAGAAQPGSAQPEES